ncbi:MAG: class I SAM-dependent DNA methyltransferase [Thermoguttaceae bacterium]
MPLSRQEIKQNAVKFAKEWASENREEAESQSFWNEFFAVFGVKRRSVASFEQKVRNIKGQFGSIDLFWSGRLLAEHKSRGKSLEKAASQAFEYIQNLTSDGRNDEIPRYIIVSNFATIVLYDLEPDEGDAEKLEFPLADLHKHVDAFAFIAGYKVHKPKPEDPANIIASELMGQVHDTLFASGYSGHSLERFLVRTLFCLFAEDTGIFEPDAFTAFIEQHTKDDGDDLGLRLSQFFDTLDTPIVKRQKNLDESLSSLQYIDGGLFEETLRPPICNRSIRNALLAATRFDWSRISPAIFGSLFQSVMDPNARRACGAHYTTEDNILKVIRPLFLDELRAEFEKVKSGKSAANRAKLQQFHDKLGRLTFFDPACGCGNFLVLAYRELRRLEMDVFEALHTTGQKLFDATFFSQVDVDQFYGIEIVEFPARIAETALWLMDHQMNLEASVRFGNYFVRLPLQKSAKIVHGNALRMDWTEVLPKEKCSYILGNPPFVGKQYQNATQKEDVQLVCQGVRNFGNLDYVACWYIKAARYIQGTKIPVGFVSTNSITQGEQVEFLWEELYKWNIGIFFAYPSFIWTSEARGKAHVHCVIIGFSVAPIDKRVLFEEVKGIITSKSVSSISPYLVEGPEHYVSSRRVPLCNIPEMIYGSKPADGGFLMVSEDERRNLSKNHPECLTYLRPILGSEEFINGIKRWCFWLVGVNPRDIMSIPEIKRRVELVKDFRLNSKKEPTRRDAEIPTLFTEIRQPTTKYLLVPRVSSETRLYIPIGWVSAKTIASDAVFVVPNAKLYHFGVLTSMMHNVWMRRVCGRLKSDYRYSAKIVYNNFIWPEHVTEEQQKRIAEKAQAVLDARALYPDNTLADLYARGYMPKELLKAHHELDRAVDRAYRKEPFTSDEDRLAFLFGLYEKLTTKPEPLWTTEKTGKKTAKRKK